LKETGREKVTRGRNKRNELRGVGKGPISTPGKNKRDVEKEKKDRGDLAAGCPVNRGLPGREKSNTRRKKCTLRQKVMSPWNDKAGMGSVSKKPNPSGTTAYLCSYHDGGCSEKESCTHEETPQPKEYKSINRKRSELHGWGSQTSEEQLDTIITHQLPARCEKEEEACPKKTKHVWQSEGSAANRTRDIQDGSGQDLASHESTAETTKRSKG